MPADPEDDAVPVTKKTPRPKPARKTSRRHQELDDHYPGSRAHLPERDVRARGREGLRVPGDHLHHRCSTRWPAHQQRLGSLGTQRSGTAAEVSEMEKGKV